MLYEFSVLNLRIIGMHLGVTEDLCIFESSSNMEQDGINNPTTPK